MQRIKSDMYKNYERWLCHKYDVNYMIMQSNMTMMNTTKKRYIRDILGRTNFFSVILMTIMERVIINGTVSCMAIHLGMAMEMP